MKNRKKFANDRSRPKDPYWSLWGKLKVRHERGQGYLDDMSELDEDAHEVTLCEEAYEEEMARVFRLPVTGVEVDWDGRHLIINGIKKEVRADAHAANSLRKYDTDADYRKKLGNGE